MLPDPQARRQAISGLSGVYLPGSPRSISDRTKARNHLLETRILGSREVAQENNSYLTPVVICEVSFDDLPPATTSFDIMSCATPERYRLLDCSEAISNRRLRLLEFFDFPHVQYATLSYVWRGNGLASLGQHMPRQEFSIKGAEDADPIGLDVLVDACIASVACGASFLWIDRLCIMQTSKRDKRWQIREMFRIYSFATVGIVAPGGLRILVPLSEETSWIHRAWTLQEAVAPISVAVLFQWVLGPGEMYAKSHGESMDGWIEVITPGRSAMMGLDEALSFCTIGHFLFVPDGADAVLPRLRVDAALFGAASAAEADPSDLTRTHHITALNLSFYITSDSGDSGEAREFAVWQSALVRTSSRPVDMVFSIMGLLGVDLDPAEFRQDDRLGATIALARELLRQGRSASWLGVAIDIPPSPYLSTFPIFPMTSVSGRAMLNTSSGVQQLVVLSHRDAVYPVNIGRFSSLKGSMDEAGYHSFHALAVMVTRRDINLSPSMPYDNPARPTQLRAMDGSTWAIVYDEKSWEDNIPLSQFQEPRSFAVILGWYNDFPSGTTGNNIRALLVTEHSHDQYHVRSYFVLSWEAIDWAATMKEHSFCVGGPEKPGELQ